MDLFELIDIHVQGGPIKIFVLCQFFVGFLTQKVLADANFCNNSYHFVEFNQMDMVPAVPIGPAGAKNFRS